MSGAGKLYAQIQQALESEAVRARISAKARRVALRAQSEAAGAGAVEFAKGVEVVEGVRPGTRATEGMKRPFARVQVEVSEEMDAADARSKLSRREIMRRASRA